jgi:hypothetical protein
VIADVFAAKQRVVDALGDEFPSVAAVGVARNRVALRLRRPDPAALAAAIRAAHPVAVEDLVVGGVNPLEGMWRI